MVYGASSWGLRVLGRHRRSEEHVQHAQRELRRLGIEALGLRFSHKHDGKAVDRLLAGYKGYLVADAATVFDHLYTPGKIVEVACWAHTRRYFCKALASDPERAQHALSPIRALYKVERTIQDESRKKREGT